MSREQIIGPNPCWLCGGEYGNHVGDCPVSEPDIESAVWADIRARQRRGIAKYGTTVANNPLKRNEWLQHAYEEALDLAIYLKRIISAESPE